MVVWSDPPSLAKLPKLVDSYFRPPVDLPSFTRLQQICDRSPSFSQRLAIELVESLGDFDKIGIIQI
ncbi:hypothetical protein J6590_064558 [Homalodisca vitripennis]|nr:hypothetical protein J6590_064558 [Homalodisca vitripennis]